MTTDYPDVHTELSNDQKIDEILASVKTTEKYFKTTLIVTVVMFVLPLLALLFIIPAFIASYNQSFEGLL